jgi:hypothetical protein
MWLAPRDVCALMATSAARSAVRAQLAEKLTLEEGSAEVLFAMAAFQKFYKRHYEGCVRAAGYEVDAHELVKVPKVVYHILKSLGFCVFVDDAGVEWPLVDETGRPVCAWGSDLRTALALKTSSPGTDLAQGTAQQPYLIPFTFAGRRALELYKLRTLQSELKEMEAKMQSLRPKKMAASTGQLRWKDYFDTLRAWDVLQDAILHDLSPALYALKDSSTNVANVTKIKEQLQVALRKGTLAMKTLSSERGEKLQERGSTRDKEAMRWRAEFETFMTKTYTPYVKKLLRDVETMDTLTSGTELQQLTPRSSSVDVISPTRAPLIPIPSPPQGEKRKAGESNLVGGSAKKQKTEAPTQTRTLARPLSPQELHPKSPSEASLSSSRTTSPTSSKSHQTTPTPSTERHAFRVDQYHISDCEDRKSLRDCTSTADCAWRNDTCVSEKRQPEVQIFSMDAGEDPEHVLEGRGREVKALGDARERTRSVIPRGADATPQKSARLRSPIGEASTHMQDVRGRGGEALGSARQRSQVDRSSETKASPSPRSSEWRSLRRGAEDVRHLTDLYESNWEKAKDNQEMEDLYSETDWGRHLRSPSRDSSASSSLSSSGARGRSLSTDSSRSDSSRSNGARWRSLSTDSSTSDSSSSSAARGRSPSSGSSISDPSSSSGTRAARSSKGVEASRPLTELYASDWDGAKNNQDMERLYDEMGWDRLQRSPSQDSSASSTRSSEMKRSLSPSRSPPPSPMRLSRRDSFHDSSSRSSSVSSMSSAFESDCDQYSQSQCSHQSDCHWNASRKGCEERRMATGGAAEANIGRSGLGIVLKFNHAFSFFGRGASKLGIVTVPGGFEPKATVEVRTLSDNELKSLYHALVDAAYELAEKAVEKNTSNCASCTLRVGGIVHVEIHLDSCSETERKNAKIYNSSSSSEKYLTSLRENDFKVLQRALSSGTGNAVVHVYNKEAHQADVASVRPVSTINESMTISVYRNG